MLDNFRPLIETPPGRYRHYKGMLYDVVGTVRHSETLEPMTLGVFGVRVQIYRAFGTPAGCDALHRNEIGV